MKKKLDIKYIDLNKVRRTVSNVSFNEELVYQAYSADMQNRKPYISKSHYDLAVKALKSGDAKKIEDTLERLGE